MQLRGMRFRLTLMLIAVALPIVAGAAAVATIYGQSAQWETLEGRLNHSASTLAAMLPLKTEDTWNDVLKAALGADAHLRWAVVTGASGTPVAVAEIAELPPDVVRADPNQPSGAMRLDSGYIRVVAPLSDGGTLSVGFTEEAFTEGGGSMAARPLAAVVALLLFGLAGWFIGGRVTGPMRDVSDRLTKVSQDLLSAARAREASAAEEAAAVEETRRTMDMLLSSAQKIADSASAVLGNAERTLDGNRDIADRIELLNRHAEKVAEILASIMQVADRTDLLALNAALEGTKAGEAGKGFTLVAKDAARAIPAPAIQLRQGPGGWSVRPAAGYPARAPAPAPRRSGAPRHRRMSRGLPPRSGRVLPG